MNSRTLEKVKKCLALSASDNPAEAAAALRQAQKLMAKHSLTMSDMRLADVKEVESGGVTKAKTLPAWVSGLRYIVANVFGVESMNRWYRRGGVYHNHAIFVGMGDKPEAAQYTYEVLFRQLSADRQRYLDSLSKRIPRAVRTRRADLFCEAWATSVRGKVEEVAMSSEDQEVVDRYKEQKYGILAEAETRRVDNIAPHDHDAIHQGSRAGSKAQLFRGVGAKAAEQQIGR